MLSFKPTFLLSSVTFIKRLFNSSSLSAIVAQSCLTLCNPMDCSLPGSSVHGILQARLLEWVAFSFSRGSSWPRDPALQESLHHLSHQGSLLLRDISKYKDRSTLKVSADTWFYLIIYKQYIRIRNESIHLFQRNTQDGSSNKVVNDSHQSDEIT